MHVGCLSDIINDDVKLQSTDKNKISVTAIKMPLVANTRVRVKVKRRV